MAKKKYKFQKRKAKSAKSVRNSMNKGGGNWGRMLWFKPDQERTVRIMQDPSDFIEFDYLWDDDAGKNGWGMKVPAYAGIGKDFPQLKDKTPSQKFVIQVALIEDDEPEGIYFLEPNQKLMKDILAHYDKRGTLLDRDFEIMRTGKGKATSYTLFADDPEERELDDLDEQDFNEELVRMVEEYQKAVNESDDDEDEEEEEDLTDDEEETEEPEASNDDEDDEEEETNDASEVTGRFTITDVDEAAYTIDAEDADGNEYETIYLDRNDQDVDDLSEGKKYDMTIYLDEEDDWILRGSAKPARGRAKKTKAKTKKRKVKAKA